MSILAVQPSPATPATAAPETGAAFRRPPSAHSPLLPPLAEVIGADLTVPLVHGGTARYVNLDYAASAPALRAVADRVAELLPLYSSVHRGAGYASAVCTSAYEAARAAIAGFVDAGDDDVVIFTRNTTDALNLLAAAVPGGAGGVLHLDIEHHANLLPWQRLGARVVYISARRRQRRKAFRWHWLPLIDEHWIAYPEFIAGRMSVLERFKIKVAGRPTVRYLDVIMSRADLGERGAILSRAGCEAGAFVLVIPGGGTGHPGADDALAEFLAAARSLAARGAATVYVGPARIGAEPNWHPLGPLPQAELAELMSAARLIVANGGSTLIQAIACGSACIAVPIAKDQAERIRRCVAAGVAAAATLDAASIVDAANLLLQNETQRAALAARAAHLQLADGVALAIRALHALVEPATNESEA